MTETFLYSMIHAKIYLSVSLSSQYNDGLYIRNVTLDVFYRNKKITNNERSRAQTYSDLDLFIFTDTIYLYGRRLLLGGVKFLKTLKAFIKVVILRHLQ